MVARLSSFFSDVLGTVLSGFSSGNSGSVTASDSVLTALGKLQGQSSLKAGLVSPAFSGTPTAPTATMGDASTQIATDAFVQAALAPMPLRNRLHNPIHELQNRGTSFSAAGYASDRWMLASSAASLTGSVASGSFGPGRFYLTANATIAAGGSVSHVQRIEAMDCWDLIGQTVTVSFYASGTASGGGLSATVQLLVPGSADVWTSSSVALTSAAVSLSSVATRYSATFTLPSSVGNGMAVALVGSATGAGSVTLNTSGVQMEIGSAATTFERRPIALEKMLCARHYQLRTCSIRFMGTSGQVYDCTVDWSEMRSTPAATLTAAGSASNASGITLVPTSNSDGRFEATSSAGIVLTATYALGYAYGLSADL